jgi:hypothetical protein
MSNQRSAASMESVVTRLRPEIPTKALLGGVEAWWSTVAECQREMARFVSDRLTKDGEAIKQTWSCPNWTDALAIQTNWMDQTARDYNAEVTKLTDLYTKAASSVDHTDHRSA